jgi:hypothetical protein
MRKNFQDGMFMVYGDYHVSARLDLKGGMSGLNVIFFL